MDALLVLLAWYFFVFLLERILPADIVEGLKMRDGGLKKKSLTEVLFFGQETN